MARKKPEQPQMSCANCKHQYKFDKGVGECRAHPMVYIPSEDSWACPPAPDDYLCGEHIVRCNS